MLASRVAGAVLVLLTMYAMWRSLLTLAVVVVAVVVMLRFLQIRWQELLPGEGRVVLITGCDTGGIFRGFPTSIVYLDYIISL